MNKAFIRAIRFNLITAIVIMITFFSFVFLLERNTFNGIFNGLWYHALLFPLVVIFCYVLANVVHAWNNHEVDYGLYVFVMFVTVFVITLITTIVASMLVFPLMLGNFLSSLIMGFLSSLFISGTTSVFGGCFGILFAFRNTLKFENIPRDESYHIKWRNLVGLWLIVLFLFLFTFVLGVIYGTATFYMWSVTDHIQAQLVADQGAENIAAVLERHNKGETIIVLDNDQIRHPFQHYSITRFPAKYEVIEKDLILDNAFQIHASYRVQIDYLTRHEYFFVTKSWIYSHQASPFEPKDEESWETKWVRLRK